MIPIFDKLVSRWCHITERGGEGGRYYVNNQGVVSVPLFMVLAQKLSVSFFGILDG